ncbi:hypothetical protein [Myxococcus virescens]|uniref:Uncharacterized protein n=1 Tax=Myxococcus virescens TaxID=83456 RepID=A0A511HI46_9BACT|nr:hypothetical protein [Myxococcus virescens]GEL73243.1 hypothetical protein MVI01_50270 [Myxococcus virescens]SDE56337.1 hypothetical protein SAMN04488504_108261 [Myxococcus virescens]
MMTRLMRVLVMGLVWVPLLARGQGLSKEEVREPPVDMASQSSTESPSTASPTQGSGEALDDDYSLGGHLVVGTLLGGVGLVTGTLVGGLVGAALDNNCSLTRCGDSFTFAIPMSLGTTLGTSLAIYLAGNKFNGRGNFGPTFLGAALGAVPFALLTTSRHDRVARIGTVGMLVTPLIGSFTGYWLARSSSPSHGTARAELPEAQAAPVLGLTQGGALVGVMGRF